METFGVILAFLITGAIVAFLAYVKIMSYRERHCPACGVLGKKLFGDYFRPEAIKSVIPEEAQKDAINVLHCGGTDLMVESVFRCPRCHLWNIKVAPYTAKGIYNIRKAQEFFCQTPNCGFSFSIMT